MGEMNLASAAAIAETATSAIIELAAVICDCEADMMETDGLVGYQEWQAGADNLRNAERAEHNSAPLLRTAELLDRSPRTLVFLLCSPDRLFAGVLPEVEALFKALGLVLVFGTPAKAVDMFMGD